MGWNADNMEQRGAEESMLMETSGIQGKHAYTAVLPKFKSYTSFVLIIECWQYNRMRVSTITLLKNKIMIE